MKPSVISLSVKVFFSLRWREAMAGISAEAAAGGNSSGATAVRADRHGPQTERSARCAHCSDAAGIGQRAQGFHAAAGILALSSGRPRQFFTTTVVPTETRL